jgi:hypothetical protein
MTARKKETTAHGLSELGGAAFGQQVRLAPGAPVLTVSELRFAGGEQIELQFEEAPGQTMLVGWGQRFILE